jgi:hypothetical protein
VTAIRPRQPFDSGDSRLAGDQLGALGFIALGRRLSADRAGQVERMESVVELPMGSRPRKPFVPLGDESEVARMALGEALRQRIVGERLRPGFLRLYPLGVPGARSPELRVYLRQLYGTDLLRELAGSNGPKGAGGAG